ncbi:hypothetical protein [Streptomyces sp. NPDC001781]
MEYARRAGHGIAVPHRVCTELLDQTRERANSRFDAALREWERGGVIMLSPGGHLGDTH